MLRRLWRWLTEPKYKKQLSQGYYDYINSAAWQKTRQLVFTIWGERCYYCGTRQKPLQANHTNYKHFGWGRHWGWGRLLEALDCRPACIPCHQREDYKRHEHNRQTWQTNRRRY